MKNSGSEKKKFHHVIRVRMLALFMMGIILVTAAPLLGNTGRADAASLSATGKTASSGVRLRKSASTTSKSLRKLSKNTKLTISGEVFTDKSSTSSETRWYKVTAKGKTGYIRADLVKDIKYGSISAAAADNLNYREGPATTFKKIGLIKSGGKMTLLMQATRSGSGEIWYRAKIGKKTAYVCGSYVNFTEAISVDLTGKSALAKSLLSEPTSGGKTRYVATFNSSNCSRLFKVRGYKKAWVPQGLAYSGSEYYVLFGMAWGQSIVTYSSSGKRLRATKFAFNMGHPNGITYDPVTKMCYIFKGNQKRIYTWDPATNKFGKSKTPYSSSGIAYDSETGQLYASSHTGIRVYSADGTFTHQRLFSRCKPGFFHYIQDCGAGGGFVFHCISGANKHKANYIDVYRIADSKYLGTIKCTLGETESVIVDNEGYVELLINHKGTYNEYIWKTPLNVNDLK